MSRTSSISNSTSSRRAHDESTLPRIIHMEPGWGTLVQHASQRTCCNLLEQRKYKSTSLCIFVQRRMESMNMAQPRHIMLSEFSLWSCDRLHRHFSLSLWSWFARDFQYYWYLATYLPAVNPPAPTKKPARWPLSETFSDGDRGPLCQCWQFLYIARIPPKVPRY